jgi:hypothetical protein
MSNYIYSTLSSSTIYVNYTPLHLEVNEARVRDPAFTGTREERVLIRGYANVADKFFVTHKGAVTIVDDTQLEWLEKNLEFIKHRDSGFIKIDRANKDIEKVTASMEPKDKSAPLVPTDFPKGKEPNSGAFELGYKSV